MNIRAHLWEALLCQKVPCVRSVGEHRSLVGAAETAAPTEWLRQEQKVAAWYGQGCPYLLLFTLLLFYFSTLCAIVWNSFSNFA